jgi:hypothetical protein
MILIGQVFLLMRFSEIRPLGILLWDLCVVLAAQYGFILPLSVILSLPAGIFGPFFY